MYAVQSTSTLRRARGALRSGRLRERVGGTVLLLGTCSLLTDISSEMVSAILPLYLVATLGFSPLQYGLVDGIYQGASALVRLAAGFLGDRFKRHKLLASLGYGLSAVCKLGLAVVGGAWAGLSAIILLDRTGKGMRTAPRDAMISLTAPEKDMGLAFGVHRAMDTAGAMIGPLVAFGLLAAAPEAYRTLFLISFFVAILGLGVITLLVREPQEREEKPADAEKPDLKAAAKLLKGTEFRALTIAGSALGLATASDGFIYLMLRDRIDFSDSLFPLLATGTAVLYMVLAAPLGRLADKIGRGKVFIGGYVLLLAVYVLLMTPSAGFVSLLLVLGLLGTYYAATDGVLMAMGSRYVPEELRGSGLALLGTATSIARLLASVLFGVLWTVVGVQAAIALFAAGLVVAMALAVRGLRIAHA
ncbi:MFS transporter [Solirubrobacter ginsenosidimutans]|uniref:MFS transporter n=1 Tax=Solirubrobacter ginsenosidimutans TaxID=490573 RepID=A0A9X3S9Y0_9ACTN|nr:MFS transporter [Solirubrobacter ginsenosidimutans]MDA0165433.1 MFS transporter [Solirubrobacter ginsenosidimutans]